MSSSFKISVVCVAVALTGCAASSTSTTVEPVVQKTYAPKAEGVAEYVWEEPMIDVIDVPPGLDPEGHYYRPGHQEVVEIRQGRWKYYRDGNR